MNDQKRMLLNQYDLLVKFIDNYVDFMPMGIDIIYVRRSLLGDCSFTF